MNNQLQSTAIIRDRGQLTIPDEIRQSLKWVSPNFVVQLVVFEKNKIIIEPYKYQKKENQWQKIWEGINLARSFKGKRGDLSKFIINDRENH